MIDMLTVEMAPFTLAQNVSKATLLAASRRLEQEFLSKAEGYRGRVLVRQDDQTWSDIVFWQSAEYAAKAMEKAAASEACSAYFRCMAEADHDDPGQGVTLFEAIEKYGDFTV